MLFISSVIYCYIFLIFSPQVSFQSDQLSTIQAICVYRNEQGIPYTCDIQSPIYTNYNDVLEIIGTHHDGFTDDDVQEVNYNFNGTSYFNGEVMTKFLNMKVLQLYGSGLKEISQNAFNNCANLETLNGLFSYVSTLPAEMLKNCKNLKYLSMDVYGMQSVPENLFGAIKSLELFRLVTSNITSLPEKLLQNMVNLKVLDLSLNRLTELHPNFLINAVNLEEIDVSFNNFEDQWDLVYALNGHTNLKSLLMGFNSFNNFDFRFFSQFQKLETLKIGTSYWNFSEISWQSFPSSLMYLTVDGIGEEIPENSFDHLVNLKSLTLSGRGIEILHKDTFKVLIFLEYLDVGLTSIKTLHPELFKNLINLSNIDLGFNKIEELPFGIFAPLVRLGWKNNFDGIKMPQNKIERLNANSFGLHPFLRYVSFYQNIINEIEHGIFRKLHPNLINADFRYNRCINDTISGENVDDNKAFSICHKNWEELIPTTSTTTESTTPGGSSKCFQSFEIFVLILVGFACTFVNSN